MNSYEWVLFYSFYILRDFVARIVACGDWSPYMRFLIPHFVIKIYNSALNNEADGRV